MNLKKNIKSFYRRKLDDIVLPSSPVILVDENNTVSSQFSFYKTVNTFGYVCVVLVMCCLIAVSNRYTSAVALAASEVYKKHDGYKLYSSALSKMLYFIDNNNLLIKGEAK